MGATNRTNVKLFLAFDAPEALPEALFEAPKSQIKSSKIQIWIKNLLAVLIIHIIISKIHMGESGIKLMRRSFFCVIQ